MGVLRNIEAKLENLLEGGFGRAFRVRVQPRELARKLAKEMESYKTVSVSRVYVPNEYTVFLSREDRKQFEGYEQALLDELSSYLLEHAARENLALLTKPKVNFDTDRRLRMGEFGIQARLVKPAEEVGKEAAQGALGATMVYSAAKSSPQPEAPADDKPISRALLVWGGRTFVVDRERAVIGRSRRCDLVIDDANISRQHCELTLKGRQWQISDLGSTNGVTVNGRQVSSARLEPGDEITIGTSKLRFDVD
jgi:hypothetical protein